MAAQDKLSREVLELRARFLGQRTSTEVETFESFGLYAHLQFRAAGLDLLVRLGQVLEVLADPCITPVPCVPEAIAGVINLRGNIVDIVELAHLVGPGDPARPAPSARRVIVCESRGGPFGLRVDEVVGIIPVAPHGVEEVPATYPDLIRRLLDGVVRCGPDRRGIAALLSVEKVYGCPEFDRVKRSRTDEEGVV